MEKTDRIRWIDIAKGIGILLVCVGHTRVGEGGPVASWITSFHMPLFFVMAGLCFDEHRYATFGTYLKRKGVSLVYPYFGLSLFIALMFVAFGLKGDAFRGIFVESFPGNHIIGFWFLRVLILVELTYALLSKTIIGTGRSLAVAFLSAAGFMVPFVHDALRMNVVLISLGYYEVGHLMREVEIGGLDEQGSRLTHLFVVSMGAFVLQIILLWMLDFSMTGYGGAAYNVFPLVAVVLALLGTVAVSATSMIVDRMPYAGTALAWIGRYSICLLAVHPTCGQLRAIWVTRCSWMGGVVSYLFELSLIVLMMWALTGPLKWFWKMPRGGRRVLSQRSRDVQRDTVPVTGGGGDVL